MTGSFACISSCNSPPSSGLWLPFSPTPEETVKKGKIQQGGGGHTIRRRCRQINFLTCSYQLSGRSASLIQGDCCSKQCNTHQDALILWPAPPSAFSVIVIMPAHLSSITPSYFTRALPCGNYLKLPDFSVVIELEESGLLLTMSFHICSNISK